MPNNYIIDKFILLYNERFECLFFVICISTLKPIKL